MEPGCSFGAPTQSVSSLATLMPVTSKPQSPSISQTTIETKIALVDKFELPLPVSTDCRDSLQEIHGLENERKNSIEEDTKTTGSYHKDLPMAPQPEDHSKQNQEPEREPTVASGESMTSLNELVRLAGLEKYHRRRSNVLSKRVHDLTLSCGLRRKFLRCAPFAYRDLVDQFRDDNQADFVRIYEACEVLQASCKHDGNPSTHPDTYLGKADVDPNPGNARMESWIQQLPQNQRDDMILFLTRLRTDPSYLADCLSNLSPSELLALTSSYKSAGAVDSVLQNNTPPTGWTTSDRYKHGLPASVDKHDPFSILFGYVCDSVDASGNAVCQIRQWATACARIIDEGKRGSLEFFSASLDSFMSMEPYPLRLRLETYLMKVLQKGIFLLDPAQYQAGDCTLPLELRIAQAAVVTTEYFDDALKAFFKLLLEVPIRDVIPDSVLYFLRAVISQVGNSENKARIKAMIVSSWLFSSFFSHLIVYPESQGILIAFHISGRSRRLILKDIATRIQQQVADAISPRPNPILVLPEVRAFVERMNENLEPGGSQNTLLGNLPLCTGNGRFPTHQYLMLRVSDVVSMIGSFYPKATGLNYGVSPTCSDNPSATSSVTTSSLCASVDSDPRSAVSTTPSLTASSMTSDALSSETILAAAEGAPVGESQGNPDPNTSNKQWKAGNAWVERDLHVRLINVRDRLIALTEVDNYMRATPLPLRVDLWAFLYISEDGKTLSLYPYANSAKTTRRDILQGNAIAEFGDLKTAILRSIDESDTNHAYNKYFYGLEHTVVPYTASTSLETRFRTAMLECESRMDFQMSHYWWANIRRLNNVRSSDFAVSTLLSELAAELQDRIEVYKGVSEDDEFWLHSLNAIRTKQKVALEGFEGQRKGLRTKMWYFSSVTHSPPYEDAYNVSRALRDMTKPTPTKQSTSVAQWARQRLRPSNNYDRASSQALEALAAHVDHGGPAKLADSQIEMTTKWLTRSSIENFCKGEERIHRFCVQIQKCVNKLTGASLLESPVLWCSSLYGREKLAFDTKSSRSFGVPGWTRGYAPTGPHSSVPAVFSVPLTATKCESINSMSRSNAESTRPVFGPHNGSSTRHQFYNSDPQINTHFNSAFTTQGFYQPSGMPCSGFGDDKSPHTVNRAQNPSDHAEQPSAAKLAFISEIKQALSSLLISDLGQQLWLFESDTDSWVNQYVSRQTSFSQASMTNDQSPAMATPQEPRIVRDFLASQDGVQRKTAGGLEQVDYDFELTKINELNNSEGLGSSSVLSYPYIAAYKKLLQNFGLSTDPYIKLAMLYELELLVVNNLHESALRKDMVTTPKSPSRKNFSTQGMTIPRTKATSLEEVIANCTERRAGTMRFAGPTVSHPKAVTKVIPTERLHETPGTDEIVNAFLSIFRNPTLRPKTLFRDLQYIAAFIPSSILDKTPRGKAFWDVGLAALALKEDLCTQLITRASQITSYHLSLSKTHPPLLPSPPSEDLANTTLRDAANMYAIVAREGSPVAARELGLFYLTHPELLPKITMPLAKSKDVFKSAGGEKGEERLDTGIFAAAFHWMELAASGGDRDARDFLRGNGEVWGR